MTSPSKLIERGFSRRFFALSSVSLLALTSLLVHRQDARATAGGALGSAPELRRDLDIRDDSDQKAPRYLVFLSRNAVAVPPSPGHALVVWGFEDPERRLCGQAGWGYYPTADSKQSVFREVPGELLDEYLKGGVGSNDVRLSLRVSDTQYAAADAVLAVWKTKDIYKLREQDCVTFVAEVAASIALGVPDRGTWKSKLPASFVSDLAALNTNTTLLTGVWEYTDDNSKLRFRLNINGKRCVWIDNPPEGTQIRHETDLIGDAPPFTLKRDNDREVLEKLGFSNARTRDQIVSRNPGPSVLSIARVSDELKARWQGLSVSKEPNGIDVKDIKFSDKAIVLRRMIRKE
jgi:hypothetical protein